MIRHLLMTVVGLLLGVGLLLRPVYAGEMNFSAHEFVTSRGMRVLLVESHTNPMVEVRLMVRAGSAYDPVGKEGLADVTAWLFNEGAGEKTAETFQEQLDFFGIRLQGLAARDFFQVSLTTLTAYLDEAFKSLGLALLQPRYDADALARAVADKRSDLIQEKEKATVQAERLLYAMLYAGHPYGHPINGTLQSLESISLEDVRRFREEGFRGPDMVMAVAGDIDQQRLQELLERHFTSMDNRPSSWPVIAPAVVAAQGQTRHLDLDVPQTAIRLGRVGINRQDPDFYALTVMDHILGGGSTSRLFKQVREKKGLAYSVSSAFSPLSALGPLVFALETKNTSVTEALGLVRKEIERMAREEVEQKELTDAIQYLTGSFPLHLDGLDKLSATWAAIGFYQRGADYLVKWPERIRAVTREDIARVARRFLDVERFVTITVGGKEKKTTE
ncbi:MAG: insulinase family protein [Magnetococcus sp. DMHC-1]|nr:insulinase family protein [Magnetococcales bacterium]